MRYMKWLLSAVMLFGVTAMPALADYDREDYWEDRRDAQRDYWKSQRNFDRYNRVVVPQYDLYNSSYGNNYPYGYNYRGNGRSLVGGVLDFVF